MATTTIKMGKRGTLVLPAKLRKQFGLEDGSLLITEAKDGEIRIRPAFVYEGEVWTPQRKACLVLINVMTKEEYDEVSGLLRQEGIDPTDVPDLDPGHRATLPTDQEWEEGRIRRVESLREKQGV